MLINTLAKYGAIALTGGFIGALATWADVPRDFTAVLVILTAALCSTALFPHSLRP